MNNWKDKFLDKVIQGDCLDVMKEIPTGYVDFILADPPYNSKKIGPQEKVYSQGIMKLPEADYRKFCFEWFKEAQRLSSVIVLTPGIANISNYPQPYWIICWHKPAAVSFNRMGGFNAWEPVFIYGKPAKGKRLGQDYILFNTLNLKKGSESGHPCPKPLGLWKWIVDKFSEKGSVILDPFLGSGTTAVAAKQLGRHYIGIEINPDYCRIAEERLAQEMLL